MTQLVKTQTNPIPLSAPIASIIVTILFLLLVLVLPLVSVSCQTGLTRDLSPYDERLDRPFDDLSVSRTHWYHMTKENSYTSKGSTVEYWLSHYTTNVLLPVAVRYQLLSRISHTIGYSFSRFFSIHRMNSLENLPSFLPHIGQNILRTYRVCSEFFPSFSRICGKIAGKCGLISSRLLPLQGA